MRDLSELTADTSSYELFTHIYWRIVTREINDFSTLVEYLKPVEEGRRKDYVLKSAFPLIREIHWGFFRELNAKTWPVLWGQLCRPNTRYPFAGELKRSMTITDTYCAFIDIHGYTALTRSSKDAPLLKLLDICIETDVKQFCRENQVVGNRARGDEIILVGTSAYDVVNTAMIITDYFGDKRHISDNEIVRKRRSERMKLPPLGVSVGIAGGKKYDSLVITAEGDLSGPVVNLAARLQSRANVVSGDSSCILVSETVRMKYEAEAEKQFAPMFTTSQMAFLDVGTFAFKGVDVRLTEVLHRPENMHRLVYAPALKTFLDALGAEAWHDTVFASLADLVVAACDAMPAFTVKGTGNAAVKSLARRAADRFESGDYSEALSTISSTADVLGGYGNTDHFLLLYLNAAVDEYRRIFESYDGLMSRFVEDRRKTLFNSTENTDYEKALGCTSRILQMKKVLVNRIPADKRVKLWRRLIKDLSPSLKSSLYLGK